MSKTLLFLLFLFLLPAFVLAQQTISGQVIDSQSKNPLPYASILQDTGDLELTNIDGSFEIELQPQTQKIRISYIGYTPQEIKISDDANYTIQLRAKTENLDEVFIESTNQLANKVIAQAIAHKPQNDPDLKFDSYSYKSYNKLIIDDEKQDLEIDLDSSNYEIRTVIAKGRSYLSEKISDLVFKEGIGVKEKVIATRTAGFEKPVYELLSLNVQSNTWYKNEYTIFGSNYASPLAKHPFSNYSYKVLDTTQTERPAFVIYFEPKRHKRVAGLEGVLYLDTLSYGLQKAVGQLKGEVEIKATQDFQYYPEEDIWFPKKHAVTLKPGTGGQKVSIFGGSISLGSLPEKAESTDSLQKLYLRSITTNQEISFNPPVQISKRESAITLLPDATEKPESFWQTYRNIPYTERDEATFAKVDSIIKKERIDRRIDVIQNFNIGYFPIGFFDVDLRTLIKYNNYEGFRLGTGGVTNEKFSERFRLQGYGVYGFKDHTFKYSVGGGIALNKSAGTWLNVNYTDDIAEVGSFNYLTDARVYSLFEPRLVNIDFYYKYQTLATSLQHRFSPKLLSEWQVSKSDIQQTEGYYFEKDNNFYQEYTITQATVSFRWTPFSDYLKGPDKVIEVNKGYPQFSFQATQAFDGVLDGDFTFTRLGAKFNYTINRITQNTTEIMLEGDYAFGDIPLTHTFHAYPNQPVKEKIADRFSVAGRRTFETMYFSEFFSDQLASLQVKHYFRPWDFGKFSQPQLVLLTRHAIGDMQDQHLHNGLTFKTLDQGYSESGFEINKVLFGFGLSFAYRYGAYHLPNIEDNISFKFTFYLKL